MTILRRIARSRIQKFLYSRNISNVKEGFVRLPKALPPEPAPRGPRASYPEARRPPFELVAQPPQDVEDWLEIAQPPENGDDWSDFAVPRPPPPGVVLEVEHPLLEGALFPGEASTASTTAESAWLTQGSRRFLPARRQPRGPAR